MRISDWSSDVCSSDLPRFAPVAPGVDLALVVGAQHWFAMFGRVEALAVEIADRGLAAQAAATPLPDHELVRGALQSEELRLDSGQVGELLLLARFGEALLGGHSVGCWWFTASLSQ